jgi:hypothetical protein
METITESHFKEPSVDKALKKKEYMKSYMREYKKKKYAENPSPVLATNRTRYLKKHSDIDSTDADKYGIYLADIIKLKQLIEKVPKTYLAEIVGCL